MTSALIVPKDNHPVQENTNKVISYESTKEIFLSRKESFPMEDAIDINNHEIENLPLLIAGYEARNKDYVDNNFFNKITGGSIRGDLDMREHSIKFLKFDESESSAARVAELSLKFDKHGGRISGPTTFETEIFAPFVAVFR